MSTAHRNRLIQRFESGEVAFGSWLDAGDLKGARVAGDSTMDFAFVDMEHLNFDLTGYGNTLQWMLSRSNAVQQSVPATPITRIPPDAAERNRWIVKQVLDYGSMGVVLPHSTHADDVRFTVEAMRYPQARGGDGPTGRRGAFPTVAMRYWGLQSFDDYYSAADLWPLNPKGELLLVLLVENVTAWDNIEELVAVPGVGAVFWGPGDGSLSLGLGRIDSGNPRLTEHRQRVVAACKAASVKVGTPAPADLGAAIDEGFDFVALSSWSEETAASARALIPSTT